jgi:hypothetical protein
VRYIALNPVEAELCERPEQWPWASHARLLGGTPPRWLDVPRLYDLLAGPERYRELTRPW